MFPECGLQRYNKRMILCTAGYKNYSFYQFKKMVEDLDALVIDVRYSPYTKLPFWGRQSLEENLCERYVHIREFGNRAYNQGEIEIDDFASGLTTFLDVTETPMLLFFYVLAKSLRHVIGR